MTLRRRGREADFPGGPLKAEVKQGPVRSLETPNSWQGQSSGTRARSTSLGRVSMAQVDIFVGIDVSKERLDVFSTAGERFSVANDPAGREALALRIRGARAAGLEASGGYEAPVLKALAQAGLAVYRLDPAQVRAFARSRGQRAKTDAIDARMIALCLRAGLDTLKPFADDAATARLAALAAFRRRLVAHKAALAGSADRIEDRVLQGLMAEQDAMLATHIARLDAGLGGQGRAPAQRPRGGAGAGRHPSGQPAGAGSRRQPPDCRPGRGRPL